jgi:hypothetical protein
MNDKDIIFKSEIEFKELEKYPANNEFKLHIWKDDKKKTNSITIFINGFLEGVLPSKKMIEYKVLERQALSRYRGYANALLKKDINSVLLPLPFHFDRGKDIDNSAPIKRLTEHGSFLYHGGYTQVINDLEKLITQIKQNPEDFGLNDNSHINFNLFGYSLGGVAAMGAAKRLNQYFSTLTILLSSWKISDIDPSEIEQAFEDKFEFKAKDWNKLLDELKNSAISDEIFNQLIWGDEQFCLPEKNEVGEILFIHGINDDLFNVKMTAERTNHLINKKASNCSFHILPSDHSGTNKFISKIISEFIAFNKSKKKIVTRPKV